MRNVPNSKERTFCDAYVVTRRCLEKNLCFKKPREPIKNIVPRDKLKIWNIELFNAGRKVLLIDENGKKPTEYSTWHQHVVTGYSKPLESKKKRNVIISSVFQPVICDLLLRNVVGWDCARLWTTTERVQILPSRQFLLLKTTVVLEVLLSQWQIHLFPNS